MVSVRIRITKEPDVRELESAGFDVRHLQVGHDYDVGPRLADYLIVCGYAVLEMRREDRTEAADRAGR
jgi:hypothetical protein